jgi:sugar O-acyltransferase (sialic acid O-acetyltransferase NeuD family)
VNTTRLLIAGAGGFGRDIYELIRAGADRSGCLDVAFLDDRLFGRNTCELPAAVLGTIRDYRPNQEDSVLVAVNDPQRRKAVSELILKNGGRLYTFIHNTAIVARNSRIGNGCVLFPFTCVGPNATLDAGVVLNYYASIGHDANAGAYSVISPYATLNGNAKTGEGVFLGTHATINPGVSVGKWSKVSAGSAVHVDTPPGCFVFTGNPKSVVMFKVTHE